MKKTGFTCTGGWPSLTASGINPGQRCHPATPSPSNIQWHTQTPAGTEGIWYSAWRYPKNPEWGLKFAYLWTCPHNFWHHSRRGEKKVVQMKLCFPEQQIILEHLRSELVGGFNDLENISQIGSFPQVGVKIKNNWNHHLVNHLRAKQWNASDLDFTLHALLWDFTPQHW